MYRQYIFIFIAMSLWLLNGCVSSNNKDSVEEAHAFCLEKNGTVETRNLDNGNITEVCVTTQTGIFDEGTVDYTFTCDIMDFYRGVCEDEGENEIQAVLARRTYSICENDNSQHCAYYNNVDNILRNLENTGYTHRPFLLDPDIGETSNKNNLFLDCSGFVGYYVLQQLSPQLYNYFPRKYSCGPLQKEENVESKLARPLAADFVDHIQSVVRTVSNHNASDAGDARQCWGRVDDISDALPGDVIAYKHNANIDTKTKYCCAKHEYVRPATKEKYYKYKSEKMSKGDHCTNGRIIYKTKLDKYGNHKSTGHVMFIVKKPYRSKRCKDKGQCKYYWLHIGADYQWVIQVGDSTNVKHTSDTRVVENSGGSNYKGHAYHAWTEGKVEECSNGTYHRDCSQYGTNVEKSVTVKGSTETHHPTGIGAGYIYVNDAMDGYRTKYSADISKATVVIGRPVVCD